VDGARAAPHRLGARLQIAWRKLEDLDGRSHTTLRKVRAAGLDAILARLNAPLTKEDAVRLAFAGKPPQAVPSVGR